MCQLPVHRVSFFRHCSNLLDDGKQRPTRSHSVARCIRIRTCGDGQQSFHHNRAAVTRIHDVVHFQFLSPPPADGMLLGLELLFAPCALATSADL